MFNISTNDSSNLSSSIQDTPSLDQLLGKLGFIEWGIVTTTLALPSISLVGIVLCALSAWIFFQSKFKDPVFFYYRLLCIVYIIHLAHNIPRGLLFTPRYYPQINTYFTSIYLIYFSSITTFLFHFEETLQIGILLMRMKIFIPFVKKHFLASPKIVSLAFFLTCLCIDAPLAFVLKIEKFGTYYYFDSNNGEKKFAEFYYFVNSDFSASIFGKILLVVSYFFLNLFLSVIVGVTLNVVSLLKYKSYVREKRRQDTSVNSNHNQATTSSSEITPKKLSQKELNEKRAEKNMFYMALTLCSISILSRCLIILCSVFFQFFSSLSTNLILTNINNTIYTLVPTSGIFVFYFFNKMFRKEFKKKLGIDKVAD
jgi:hypothetical protein